MSLPTIDEVTRIAAFPDPVVRNLQITQCYYAVAGAQDAARAGGELVHICDLGVEAGRPVDPRGGPDAHV